MNARLEWDMAVFFIERSMGLADHTVDKEVFIDNFIKSYSMENVQFICRTLDRLAQNLSYWSEYLSVRAGADGTGEHPHEDAEKHAMKTMKGVRKAQGYNV